MLMQFNFNFIYISTFYFQTITLEDVDDYLITAAIHPAQVRGKKDLKNVILFKKLYVLSFFLKKIFSRDIMPHNLVHAFQ